MPEFTPPAYVEQNRLLRARAAHRPHPCGLCQQWAKTHLYTCGWRCQTCAQQAGLQPVRNTTGGCLLRCYCGACPQYAEQARLLELLRQQEFEARERRSRERATQRPEDHRQEPAA